MTYIFRLGNNSDGKPTDEELKAFRKILTGKSFEDIDENSPEFVEALKRAQEEIVDGYVN